MDFTKKCAVRMIVPLNKVQIDLFYYYCIIVAWNLQFRLPNWAELKYKVSTSEYISACWGVVLLCDTWCTFKFLPSLPSNVYKSCYRWVKMPKWRKAQHTYCILVLQGGWCAIIHAGDCGLCPPVLLGDARILPVNGNRAAKWFY
jgi:hypothetical protein